MGSHDSQGIEELVRFATEFIRRAGDEALTFYGKGKSSIKFDEVLVTEAELHLTEFFQDHLHARFPGHQMFGKNPENAGYSHEDKRYLWIWDPLDGVANFQAGIPVWGLSLALLENFWPVFGVFHMPVTRDLFHARAGQRAYWGERQVRVSSQDTINDESLLLTYSRFHQRYRTTFPGKVRDLGCTTAHMCYVAMGRAEAAVIDNESFQGLAAARVIVEAAGGRIYRMDGREFFLNEYLDGQRIGDPLLVASPETSSQVRNYLMPT